MPTSLHVLLDDQLKYFDASVERRLVVHPNALEAALHAPPRRPDCRAAAVLEGLARLQQGRLTNDARRSARYLWCEPAC